MKAQRPYPQITITPKGEAALVSGHPWAVSYTHLVDFHAQATSEKLAMAYYLDGRVSALWGTHTHVPTCLLYTSRCV